MSTLKFSFNPTALGDIKGALLKETQDTFLLDIVPEAARNSPVTTEGMAHNVEEHRKRPGGTGTNRRSIDAEITVEGDGVKAELFTASGYGGYLELGTSKMHAQPFLYPAFIKMMKGFQTRVKARLK